ncbi:E3 ubiquitin-protein like [Actinidia chinensis var. chinensis]|uniref:RING-type E3 ubiquitin transferase n=1 Tax=Actinidia chinensis var. chinensis TaxID=1590841 RepID=A0A2R6PK40_ACTCC|nr:E3 ubiquitin-protein like [Actinidia chinensis var. chinensis]
MADFVSLLENPPIVSSASSSGALDDDLEDACSICLEPFSSEDCSTVTNCKHEYHLHCILEWSQRSKECPICWQLLVLKDPASQELLAEVENERNLRAKRNAYHIHDDNEINHDNSYIDDSDFEERIMRHFAAAARRARYANRRGRPRSSGVGPSELLLTVPSEDLSDVQRMHTSPEERLSSRNEFFSSDSPDFGMLTTINAQRQTSVVRDDINRRPNSGDDGDGFIKPSQLSPESPQRPSSSEFIAFSESIKSKFSAASSRYKESISKSTQGFKEKLFPRNISVKELGKGVQREMNAGIAGVARIIERLDLTNKRTVASVPLSSSSDGTSNFSCKGKSMQESVITQSPNANAEETANDMSSAASPCVQGPIPGRFEAPLAQSGN